MNIGQASPDEVSMLLATYKDLAVAWDGERQAKKANRVFDRLHAIALQLRPLETGRAGLEALLAHENRGVRLKVSGTAWLGAQTQQYRHWKTWRRRVELIL